MSLVMIIGVLGTGFLLLYFTFNLEMKDHPLLRFVLVMFAFLLVLLVPKIIFDNQTVCETVVANSTAVNSTTTHYDYESFCFELPGETHTTFMKIIYWLFRIFVIYVILYLFIDGIKNLLALRRRGRV